jgi:hypothetical protein
MLARPMAKSLHEETCEGKRFGALGSGHRAGICQPRRNRFSAPIS